jgi:hypothetical protein
MIECIKLFDRLEFVASGNVASVRDIVGRREYQTLTLRYVHDDGELDLQPFEMLEATARKLCRLVDNDSPVKPTQEGPKGAARTVKFNAQAEWLRRGDYPGAPASTAELTHPGTKPLSPAPTNAEMARRLLKLPHPDLNCNSSASNEATTYLLNLRNKP